MTRADRYHKWVEWSDEDQIYIGQCPDVMTGIHGEDAVQLYGELCTVVEEILEHLEAEGRTLPLVSVRPTSGEAIMEW